MIAAAISFNSGILLFADADRVVPAGIHESKRIFPKQYGSSAGCARSIFVVSEQVDWGPAAFQHCESALDSVPAVDCTIDRMRETIEKSLFETYHEQVGHQLSEQEHPLFVVLYSPCEKRYCLFHTIATALLEVGGYDCLGGAAYLGHYLIRNRYNAARSMDGLDLGTVFSIAAETLEGVRECYDGCGKSSEMAVMYADGHVSEIQRIPQDTRKQRTVALTGLART